MGTFECWESLEWLEDALWLSFLWNVRVNGRIRIKYLISLRLFVWQIHQNFKLPLTTWRSFAWKYLFISMENESHEPVAVNPIERNWKMESKWQCKKRHQGSAEHNIQEEFEETYQCQLHDTDNSYTLPASMRHHSNIYADALYSPWNSVKPSKSINDDYAHYWAVKIRDVFACNWKFHCIYLYLYIYLDGGDGTGFGLLLPLSIFFPFQFSSSLFAQNDDNQKQANERAQWETRNP